MLVAPTQRLSYHKWMHNAYCNLPQSDKTPPWDMKSMSLDLDLAPCSSVVKVGLRQTLKCCPKGTRRQHVLRPVGPLICQRPPSSRLGRCSCLKLPRPAKALQTPELDHRPLVPLRNQIHGCISGSIKVLYSAEDTSVRLYTSHVPKLIWIRQALSPFRLERPDT